jgi:hypothetical protein
MGGPPVAAILIHTARRTHFCIREMISMTEEKRVNELLVQCVRNTRIMLGALRAFVPDDLLPLVNRFLVYTGSVELRATGNCSHEGNGWEKELAMKTIRQLINDLSAR